MPLEQLSRVDRGKDDQRRAELSPEMSAITPPSGVTGDLDVQLREIKLVSERLLTVLGVPYGARVAARQFAVAAVAVSGAEALTDLARISHDVPAPEYCYPVFHREDPATGEVPTRLRIDNRGQSLLLTGSLVLDRVCAEASTRGVEVHLENAEDAAHLQVITHLLDAYSFLVRPTTREPGPDMATGGSAPATTVFHVAPPTSGRVPSGPNLAVVWRTLEERLYPGITIPAATWWQLYYTSNRALSEDTPLSRYHTGDTLRKVTEHGEFYVRQDDPWGKNAHLREIFIDAS